MSLFSKRTKHPSPGLGEQIDDLIRRGWTLLQAEASESAATSYYEAAFALLFDRYPADAWFLKRDTEGEDLETVFNKLCDIRQEMYRREARCRYRAHT